MIILHRTYKSSLNYFIIVLMILIRIIIVLEMKKKILSQKLNINHLAFSYFFPRLGSKLHTIINFKVFGPMASDGAIGANAWLRLVLSV